MPSSYFLESRLLTECKVIDTRFVAKYCLFVLEVLQAWIDPAQKNSKTIHHHGYDFATLILEYYR